MSDEIKEQLDSVVEEFPLQEKPPEPKAGTQDNLTFEKSDDPNLCCIYQRTEAKDFLIVFFILTVGQAEYGRSLSFKLGTGDDEISNAIAKDRQGVQERAGVK